MQSVENIIAISDLHLGASNSLIALPNIKKRLINTLKNLGEFNCFILLGDILDLTLALEADAWNTASKFFYDIFQEIAKEAVIYYIIGNHDHHIWNLLIEHDGIVNPLIETIEKDNKIWPTLESLKLINYISNNKNFIHALFPQNVRGGLHVEYPFKILPYEEKILILHHGHYFDSKITPFAQKVAERYKGDSKTAIKKIEEKNLAWIESLFYFLSIGPTNKDFVEKMYGYYEALDKFILSFSKLAGINIIKKKEKCIGNLSIDYILEMISNIFRKDSYVLVFGHTHKRDTYISPMKTIEMYNIGGWIVENNKEPEPTILQIKDSKINLIPFNVKKEEIDIVMEKARNISPLR